MMLFIDTSDNEMLKLAVIDPKTYQIRDFSWESKSSASDTLAVNIKDFLKKHRISFKDLTKVAVLIGPGHFSRIRTGVATANSLGFSLTIPVVGVKKGQETDFKKLFLKKGEKQVKPYYDRGANITKPKKHKLKI